MQKAAIPAISERVIVRFFIFPVLPFRWEIFPKCDLVG
jgi:hypothetical protein